MLLGWCRFMKVIYLSWSAMLQPYIPSRNSSCFVCAYVIQNLFCFNMPCGSDCEESGRCLYGSWNLFYFFLRSQRLKFHDARMDWCNTSSPIWQSVQVRREDRTGCWGFRGCSCITVVFPLISLCMIAAWNLLRNVVSSPWTWRCGEPLCCHVRAKFAS